jgi:alpha-ketoglutarate-dependent taurine dioxygenase
VDLGEEERKALFVPLETARQPGMALNFKLEPGDIQINNNLSTLHQRTEYVDFEEPEKKRHLLRLWLASNQPRPLAREFEERFNGGWSFRKGIPVTKQRQAA